MKLALFDLDNTLLAGDSDHAWGDWLCKWGILDKAHYKAKNDEFYERYQAGTMDVMEYLNFSLAILGKASVKQLHEWQLQFMRDTVEPMILKKGEELLEQHRKEGHKLVIITATNRFITEPIAKRLGVNNLIATECEMKDGHYTGRPTGVPCYQEGKVTRLKDWLKQNNADLEGSYFYSDSKNDLPLLSLVENPVAVDPDEDLKKHAQTQGWPIISLRN
ncbi:histidinol-phosphatase [Entomomonas asaccharolytica]|uniref:Histidinol-phosphatase n=1 Tax=Entomomonas asaccharolytica TaxID=2785331 RepID=A0A974NE57_9GAMM|nr:HAD family hydrolase [Entomomonas asaccharolytica]QQP84944.1 HAD family hydrolase [Entomomonas asaccharolytica]